MSASYQIESGAESTDKILIVDDDPSICELVGRRLRREGIDSESAGTGEEALKKVDGSYSAVLMDLMLPGIDGETCIARIKQRYPDTPIIAISAADDVKRAVAAIKAGAYEYLRKPVDNDDLVLTVKRALDTRQLSRENERLRQALVATEGGRRWVSVSQKGGDVFRMAERIANSDATVLITGETGTGKSLLARLVHHAGRRCSLPFVTVSCGTLPRELIEAELFGHEKGAFTGATKERPGRIEIAGKGTLYLDEVGDLPLSLQSKVLRMLQEREFERIGGNKTIGMDARVIASTHKNLLEMCEAGEFRQDLFFRLNVIPLRIPPLRERKEDIEPIALDFLAQMMEKEGVAKAISPGAMTKLKSYDWPGNVRELQNLLERAFTLSHGDTVEETDIVFLEGSDRIRDLSKPEASLAGLTMSDIEKTAIQQTLSYCAGNKAKAARTLGISEKSIYNKMKRLGISSPVR